jgi:hypothetical protein
MRRLWIRAGVGVAVVGAVSVGVIGIAAASGDEPQARAAAQEDNDNGDNGGDHWGGPWGGGWGGGWGGDFGGLDGILGEGAQVTDILHGEVVLAKEGGGTHTVLVQKGVVTEASGESVTVRSADEFTTTFAVNGDTKVKGDTEDMTSVAAQEEVLVIAPKSGDQQTATVLINLTDLDW